MLTCSFDVLLLVDGSLYLAAGCTAVPQDHHVVTITEAGCNLLKAWQLQQMGTK
jgi:hypothetical protein